MYRTRVAVGDMWATAIAIISGENDNNVLSSAVSKAERQQPKIAIEEDEARRPAIQRPAEDLDLCAGNTVKEVHREGSSAFSGQALHPSGSAMLDGNIRIR